MISLNILFVRGFQSSFPVYMELPWCSLAGGFGLEGISGSTSVESRAPLIWSVWYIVISCLILLEINVSTHKKVLKTSDPNINYTDISSKHFVFMGTTWILYCGWRSPLVSSSVFSLSPKQIELKYLDFPSALLRFDSLLSLLSFLGLVLSVTVPLATSFSSIFSFF